MSRIFARLVLVVALVVGVGGPLPDLLANQVTAQPDPKTITVYVTRTGQKYHRDGCRYLSRSKIPMSLKAAAARYEPCRVCKPPVLTR